MEIDTDTQQMVGFGIMIFIACLGVALIVLANRYNPNDSFNQNQQIENSVTNK